VVISLMVIGGCFLMVIGGCFLMAIGNYSINGY
jgi:hypothetical protein